MGIEQANCMRRFIRMCDDGWVEGWHESNGGNLSYRLDDEDVRVVMPYLKVSGEGHDWVGLGRKEPDIANALFLVTAAGSPMRKVSIDPTLTCGIVEIDASGSAWRKVWGLRDARPTSEFLGHLLAHAALIRDADGDSRVVYHAHCQNVIALSLLLNASEAEWNRALWGAMTEVVMLTPQGVGVLPWMLPGSRELAEQSAQKVAEHAAVVWSQHGLLATGADFDETFGLAHTIEKAASIYLKARAANGGVAPEHLVTPAQLRAVCDNLGEGFNEDILR